MKIDKKLIKELVDNLKVLRASSDVKQPAVLGKKIIFFGFIKSVNIGFFLSKIFTRLTATVTISAPEALMAFAVSEKFLYFPVPTISLDLSDLLATLKISFFKLSSSYKVHYFYLIIIF